MFWLIGKVLWQNLYKQDKSETKSRGVLHATAEEAHATKGRQSIAIMVSLKNRLDIVELRFRGSGLDKKDFFGKSDPYLEVSF